MANFPQTVVKHEIPYQHSGKLISNFKASPDTS